MIDKLDVFLNIYNKELIVGQLVYMNKKIYFEYDKSFLTTGIEISPYKLPLRSGVMVCDDDLFEGLFGVFADSLPDGWGRLLLDRYFLKNKIAYHDITPLDRLAYIGSFSIGALGYRPIINDSLKSVKNIDLDNLADGSNDILIKNSTDNIDNFLVLGGSSSGARPKIMVQINDKDEMLPGSQKLKSGYKHYMVKFASSLDNKNIGKEEYRYSLMAKKAGIDMPNTKLLEGKNNSYFAIERFDRIGDERVHIHSVAGLTHSDFRMPVLDYDDLLALTLHLTKDLNEVVKMFRLACFNLFAHNRDDHAKNFSFLLNKENQWKLSPAYDLTFSYGPDGEHSTTYLGEGKNPTEKHLIKLATLHNIKNGQKIIDKVKSVIKEIV